MTGVVEGKAALAGVLVAARVATSAAAADLMPELARTVANEALEAAAKLAGDAGQVSLADDIRGLKQ